MKFLLLGSTPYPGMGAREVMKKVRDGYRLERPAHCHPDFYHIIQKCWLGDMNKRPDFSELRKVILLEMDLIVQVSCQLISCIVCVHSMQPECI